MTVQLIHEKRKKHLTAFSRKTERVARIPEQEVERLKREVSLERLVEAKGVQLQRRGADLHGCCPFHDDKTPSLVITPSKNLWHCFGACATETPRMRPKLSFSMSSSLLKRKTKMTKPPAK